MKLKNSANELEPTFQDSSGYFGFTNTELNELYYGFVQINEQLYLSIKTKQANWNFLVHDNKFRYINGYGKAVELKTADSTLFDGRERLGSNRGYIWSRTIPLLDEALILGTGPDSFALRFPQTDYVMMSNVFGDAKKIVDKPHSQYIGFLIEFGMLGTIIFLVWISKVFWDARSSILSISLLCILSAFLFYDISTGTGWLLITCIGLLKCLYTIKKK